MRLEDHKSYPNIRCSRKVPSRSSSEFKFRVEVPLVEDIERGPHRSYSLSRVRQLDDR